MESVLSKSSVYSVGTHTVIRLPFVTERVVSKSPGLNGRGRTKRTSNFERSKVMRRQKNEPRVVTKRRVINVKNTWRRFHRPRTLDLRSRILQRVIIWHSQSCMVLKFIKPSRDGNQNSNFLNEIRSSVDLVKEKSDKTL